MQKTIFSFNTVANNLNFSQSLKFFFICILNVLFFFTANLQAQQTDPSQQIPSPTIVLKDGAKLFSTDQNFNNQILTHKIVLKNSELSVEDHKNSEQSLRATAKKPLQKDLKSQQKAAEVNKQKETLKKVKKEIDQFNENKEAFQQIDFKVFPSSSQFFSSNTVSKDYVSPTQSNHDLSKLYVLSDAHSITRALDYLHSKKYTYYNNKSLDFCFSEVFSVRPPPVFNIL